MLGLTGCCFCRRSTLRSSRTRAERCEEIGLVTALSSRLNKSLLDCPKYGWVRRSYLVVHQMVQRRSCTLIDQPASTTSCRSPASCMSHTVWFIVICFCGPVTKGRERSVLKMNGDEQQLVQKDIVAMYVLDGILDPFDSGGVPVESVLELNPVCCWRRHGGECVSVKVNLVCVYSFVSIAPGVLACSVVSL